MLAEQALRGAVQLRTARSVIIRDAKGFEALVKELQRALVNSFSEGMRKGIVAALDRLRDLGPGAFTEEDGSTILRALEREAGAEALAAATRAPLINLSDGLYRMGLAEVGTAAGTSLAFMRPDQDALDVLTRANQFWVGDLWDTGPRDKIKALLTEYFTTGLTRETLARRLAEDFAGVSENSLHHWRSVANALATRSREIGRVAGYERAAIAQVQIKAIVDDRTTTVCRHLHGRVLTVTGLRDQATAWGEASSRGNRVAAFAAWPFFGDGDDLSATPTADLQGVGMPPYHHGNCRTITVAYFGPRTAVEGLRQKALDRADLTGDDRKAIQDRAAGAAFLRDKQARAKFQRHRAAIPTRKLDGYEADARALITDPGATLYISTRVPGRNMPDRPDKVAIHALYAKAMPHKASGEAGYLVTVIDLEDGAEGVIVSHHWRDRMTSENDVTPARAVMKKGVLQWLTSFMRKA